MLTILYWLETLVDALATGRTEQNLYKNLQNVYNSFELLNLINIYTRIENRKGFNVRSAIDKIFTNLTGARVKIIVLHHTAENAEYYFHVEIKNTRTQ